jgi:uncharacterized protein (DUF983 family)
MDAVVDPVLDAVVDAVTPDSTTLADLLMSSGVARTCPDCMDERIFVPVDESITDELCCTSCGAAVLLDPFLDRAAFASRVA